MVAVVHNMHPIVPTQTACKERARVLPCVWILELGVALIFCVRRQVKLEKIVQSEADTGGITDPATDPV